MRRLLLLAAVLGTAAAGAPLSALNKYVAIGDSITVGSTWPSGCMICPVFFDCVSACKDKPQTKRDQCGFVGRLDSWLGADHYVKNRGVGGEKTLAAASRFANEMDAECGTPGDCLAVFLMHGTNDMNKTVSPETATANLGFMIAEAKSRNIDTVLMTIIRRGFDPNNSKWQTYKNLILDLALAENLQWVDPWLSLCPDTSCYNANYWLVGQPSCFDPNASPVPGHLDPEGYDVLTGLIQAEFPVAAPAAPAPTSPTGDIADPMPDFVWPEVVDARWYELDVDGATTWWEAAVHCTPGGDCTADPGVVLPEAAHSWRVRGRNLRGMGAWSADTGFVVWGVPGTPVAASPTGTFPDVDPLNPPFGWEPYTWSEVADATHYDLEVANGGGPVLQRSYDASICLASTCTASPGVGLADGSYSWTVQGRNPATVGTPSAPQPFDVDHLPPGEPIPTAPTGEHFELFAPLYEWLPAPGATEYDFEVKDMAGNIDDSAAGLSASVYCISGNCSYQGGILASPDVYVLRVLGRNVAGDGMLSTASADFTVLACDEPSPQDLSALITPPSPVTTTEPVSHCGPVTAAAGAPYIIDTLGDVTVHTRDGFSAYDGFTVKGTLTVRSP